MWCFLWERCCPTAASSVKEINSEWWHYRYHHLTHLDKHTSLLLLFQPFKNQLMILNYEKRNFSVIYLQRGSTRSLSRKSWSFFTAAMSMGNRESVKGDTILRLLATQMKIHCQHLNCFVSACSLKSSMTNFTQLWFPSSCICDPFQHHIVLLFFC